MKSPGWKHAHFYGKDPSCLGSPFPVEMHSNTSSARLMRLHPTWAGLGASPVTSPGGPAHGAPRVHKLGHLSRQPLVRTAGSPRRELGEASRLGNGRQTRSAVANVHRLTSGAPGVGGGSGVCVSPPPGKTSPASSTCSQLNLAKTLTALSKGSLFPHGCVALLPPGCAPHAANAPGPEEEKPRSSSASPPPPAGSAGPLTWPPQCSSRAELVVPGLPIPSAEDAHFFRARDFTTQRIRSCYSNPPWSALYSDFMVSLTNKLFKTYANCVYCLLYYHMYH